MSILGSMRVIVAFVTTAGFPVTTPGMFEAAIGGLPARTMTGGFPTKDAALPGISGRAPAHALRATRSTLSGSSQDYAGY